MKKQQLSRIFLLSMFALTLGSTLFYYEKANRLQDELVVKTEDQTALTYRMDIYKKLLAIDSLLVSGDYSHAIDAYEGQFKGLETIDSSSIALRIALSRKMQRLYREKSTILGKHDGLRLQDTIAAPTNSPKAIQQYDSLGFVLEKTKVQLARVQRQLRQKSLGEYLTFTSSKGSEMHYVGQVRHHRANGHGIALLSTGSRYEGEWKDNLRHGEGAFYWPDGEYYVGNYVHDKREGKGTYYWPNGEKYVGQWKDDQRYGQGIFYAKDGKIMANGIWKADELVQVDK
ncbi:MAG: hypothetical protein AAGB24_11085 [Bacteroidota bacterium]